MTFIVFFGCGAADQLSLLTPARPVPPDSQVPAVETHASDQAGTPKAAGAVHPRTELDVLSAPPVAGPSGGRCLNGTTLAQRPELASVNVLDELRPFSCGGMNGVFQDRVGTRDSTGGLEFDFFIRSTGPNQAAVAVFRPGLGAYPNDIDYRFDSLGENPVEQPCIAWVSASGAAAPTSAGDAILEFDHPMSSSRPMPNGSHAFFVGTNASNYTSGTGTIRLMALDGSGRTCDATVSMAQPLPN